MSNPYFRFKQFTVHQRHDGLKVCTDGCLFGALIETRTAKSVLDIGTGTGLLALMLAQKCEAGIEAIEIDEESFTQATENVALSSWADRVKVLKGDIRKFRPAQYDLIVSNPPFFQNSLKNSNQSKNTALHAESLSLNELAESVFALSHSDTAFWVLLPEFESGQLKDIFEANGWFLLKSVHVKDKEDKPVIRVINCFGKQLSDTEYQTIVIRENSNEYTDNFVSLLKPYYLYL